MKKSLLFLSPFLFFIHFNLSAQFVTIPDANFVSWLQSNYPSCMSGNQMDTTCAGIINETNVSCTYQSISNLEGIQYFDSLLTLNCNQNPIISLPNLPTGLTLLNCSYTDLVALNNLPNSITTLICGNTPLTSISNLPISLIYLLCSYTDLVSLPPLPAGLLKLTCNNSDINALPALPSTLQWLICNVNQISTIPPLPADLKRLDISNNPITSPIVLPNGLERYFGNSLNAIPMPILPVSIEIAYAKSGNFSTMQNLSSLINCFTLDIGGNPLITLPALPTNIVHLFCNGCDLTSLPALPSNISTLEVNSNSLTVLPTLPSNLYKLEANNNNISVLPALPSNMGTLYVKNNNLTSITNLPNTMSATGLGINLDNNQLTQIPNFPISVGKILINDNMLTDLPILPVSSLAMLQLENNNLSCLPELPSTIQSLNLDNNPINCLPNYINVMNNDPWLSTLPLCEYGDITNNPSGCATVQGIEGYINYDETSDCILSTTDYGVKNISLDLYDNVNALIGNTSSSTIGRYFFSGDPGTAYTVKIDTLNKPFEMTCASPGIDSSFTINTVDSLITSVNFLLECKPGFDIGTQSIIPVGYVFPGQVHQVKIGTGDLSQWYGLNCADGISGTVTVNVTGPVTFISSTGMLTPTVSGTSYTYTVTDFGAFDLASPNFRLDFETDTTAQAGDLICVSVDVTPTLNDNNPSNNSFSFCYAVSNSYDPNIKTVYPSFVRPGYDDWLTYTIHFQNTGNAPAFNIRLEDTLSNHLDLSTFEVIGYSHLNNYHLSGKKLTVYYPNIMLPDSTSDEPGSKGYIQYRVKPSSNLPLGTEIENTAHIFFDYNDAIVTNTVTTSYNNTLSINSLNYDKLPLRVYPNPVKNDLFFIESEASLTNPIIKTYDILGQELASNVTSLNGKFMVELNHQTKGIVLIIIKADEGTFQSKLIVE